MNVSRENEKKLYNKYLKLIFKIIFLHLNMLLDNSETEESAAELIE